MHYCYIIYSQSADRFYIGETNNFSRRIAEHNNHIFRSSFSIIANDWCEYMIIELPNIKVARTMERRLKKMKSRKLIERLKINDTFRTSFLNEITSEWVLVPMRRDEPK